jgi:hypothetical protein
MAKKKKKSFWKKAGKAALIAGALYGAAKLGKGRLKGRADKLTEGDIGLGQRAPNIPDAPYIKRKIPKIPQHFDPNFLLPGSKEGGRISKKGGGRTGKQFGGGLNRPVGGVARPVGGVGAPVRPLGYKKGGHVKSMGIAKRGGGVAKK